MTKTANPPPTPWTASLVQRIRTLWVVKMLGTMVGIAGFFLLYFWVLHTKVGSAVAVPMTAIDRWVGVNQVAVYPYASLWVYVALAPAFARDLAGLRKYIIGALTMAGLGLATFWLYPTVTPAFGVDWAEYPALHMLKNADPGGNAFPSLHVAFAAHSGVVIAEELRSLFAPAWVRAINWLWCVAIIYSTLATRQHVAIDVAGGLVVAALAVLVAGRAEEWLAAGRRATPAPSP